GNTLDITLRHKVAQITTILKSTVIGNDITAIDNAMITPHYTNGTIPLTSGSITGRTDMTNTPITFPISTPGLSQRALPVFVNTDTGGDAKASFSANVMSGGISHAMSVPNSFKITPGVQSSLTVSLTKCGAFIAPNEWKDFMCHNLGADYSADPFVPSAAIHGAKYQWGMKDPVVTQAEDQADSGPVPGWTNTFAPNDTWANTKTTSDPCPSGYRVPSAEEWQGVIDNNKTTRVGTWIFGADNYSSGYQFGQGLFLPAAGGRSTEPINKDNPELYDGTLAKYAGGRGNRIAYHSTTTGIWRNDGNTITYPGTYPLISNSISQQNVTNAVAPRNDAMPIRCIAEK
ncbi:TPA: hypothetical protein ACGZ99_003676, partial [Elizabethkingia anophelis]